MPQRPQLLRYALIVIGIGFCSIYPMGIVWPSGWVWHDGAMTSSVYFMMIVSVYATLGVFLIVASRDPAKHRSLILFTIWSSAVHGSVMLLQSATIHAHNGHLIGDVPGLLLVAVVLGVLLPREAH